MIVSVYLNLTFLFSDLGLSRSILFSNLKDDKNKWSRQSTVDVDTCLIQEVSIIK